MLGTGEEVSARKEAANNVKGDQVGVAKCPLDRVSSDGC